MTAIPLAAALAVGLLLGAGLFYAGYAVGMRAARYAARIIYENRNPFDDRDIDDPASIETKTR